MRQQVFIRVGDHSPEATEMPTASQAKAVLAMSRDEILLGRNVALTHFTRAADAVGELVDAFEDGRFAEIKQASERVRETAHALAATAKQIEYLAAGIVNGCVHQLTRRPRP